MDHSQLTDLEVEARIKDQKREESRKTFFGYVSFSAVLFGPLILFPNWPHVLGMAVIAAGLGLIYAALCLWKTRSRTRAWPAAIPEINMKDRDKYLIIGASMIIAALIYACGTRYTSYSYHGQTKVLDHWTRDVQLR